MRFESCEPCFQEDFRVRHEQGAAGPEGHSIVRTNKTAYVTVLRIVLSSNDVWSPVNTDS